MIPIYLIGIITHNINTRIQVLQISNLLHNLIKYWQERHLQDSRDCGHHVHTWLSL